MAERMDRSSINAPVEPTVGELYEHVVDHGPVLVDGWRITAWPTEPVDESSRP